MLRTPKYFGSAVCRVLAIALVLVVTQRAFAITVILKNKAEPIRGFLVSEDARQIQLRVPQSDGTFQEKTIAKSDIDLVHRPVDLKRLAELSPDQPKAYRDYADDLASKRIDPEAREMGLRLYAIAAHLDPASLGRSSLLGMTALAGTVEEERRYRALAFLLDPEHDRTVLKDAATAAAQHTEGPPTNETAAILGAIKGIELLRKGRTKEAAEQLRREGIGEAIKPFASVITFEALLDECRSKLRRGPAAPPELAARLLRLELLLLGEKPTAGDEVVQTEAWSHLNAGALSQTARPLTIDTITPFDPSQCVFRDGKWVAP